MSIRLLIFLYAVMQQLIIVAEQSIIPSVINGMCSVCHTSSCANCPKAGRFTQSASQRTEARSCSICSNKGALCSQEVHQRFDDRITPRLTCQLNSEGHCSFTTACPRTIFIPRSVGTNTARELAGWEEFIHQYGVGEYYVTTGHVLGYYHSLRPRSIARVLFGDCVLRFAGSQVTDRGGCELLADNFGLSPFMRGRVGVHPTIENIVFDNQFFIGLDPLYPGLYVRIHAPLVHTRWSLGLTQQIDSVGCPPFPPGAVGLETVSASCNILQALEGTRTFGDMKKPWSFGHIRPGVQTKTGLADIDLIVGCDFIQCEDYHFGLYGQLGIPCGNRPSARFVFAPLIGNGRHLEAGIGISGHMVFWQRDAYNFFAFYCEGNATHLFKTTQHRSFDFCNNGLLSRYMLLKEFIKEGDQFVYSGNLINGIDLATRKVAVSIALQGDISATLCFRSPCIIADLGYNFYGRTKEHVTFKDCGLPGFFGVKGTEGVYGLEYTTTDTLPVSFGTLVGEPALNSTQHNATAFHGACTDNPVPVPVQNPSNIVVTAFSRQEGVIEGPDVIRAELSRPPVLITGDDLHKHSGVLPSQATHKVFGYLGYNFFECDRYFNPYLGLGGELELDAFSFRLRTALNQWSVWVKGGFEF